METCMKKIAEAFVYAATALEAQTVIATMEPAKAKREPPRTKYLDGILFQTKRLVD